MWDLDNKVVLTFNGEIYNFIELRHELQGLGHRFKSESDSEVLLTAYLQWGTDALHRLRGMFAFALWDVAHQRMLLARDPFGKKPLFLVDRPGELVFSSEINALVKFPNFDRSFDSEALAGFLLNRYVPGPLTFFRSVKKLQPGCYAVWENGKIQISRYFIPPFATVTPDIKRIEEAVELFDEVFDEAVRIRMRSDAAYGVFLSGGIDSSAVLGAMMRHGDGVRQSFSVGFEEREYSELKYSKLVAEHFGTEHHELVISSNEFFANWNDAVLHRGAPVTEASDIPIMMLSREASKIVKMVLTGEGADELLGGYPKHQAERWIALYQNLIPDSLHKKVFAQAVRWLPYGARRIKVAAKAAEERELVNRMRLWFGGISRQERDVLLGDRQSSAPLDEFPFSASVGSNVRRTLFFDQTSWLPDNLLERGDRMMMAGSIEGRMPFMDTELARVVARMPDKFLIGCPGGKAVLRKAVEKLVPPPISKRRKVGFRVPFNEWFRGPYRQTLEDLLIAPNSNVSMLCNRKAVCRLVRDHVEGRQNNERTLWALANLELFFRNFKVSGIEEAVS